MNYYTLTFKDANYERQYLEEQFQIEKEILKKIVFILMLVFIGSSINNFIIGNPVIGIIFLILTLIIAMAYRFSYHKILRVDILVFVIQTGINLLYPTIVYLDPEYRTPYLVVEPFDEYAKGLLIAYLTLTCLLGSKYYLKAFPFVLAMTSQFIVMGLKGITFTFPIKLFFIVSVLTAITHIYHQELGRRRNFISVKKNMLCNQNVLSNFRLPYFSCYLDEFSLKLIDANDRAKNKFQMTNQSLFLQVLRTTKLQQICGNPPDLERYIYKFIKEPQISDRSAESKQVVTVIGTYNKSQFQYHISKYLDEERSQVVLINVGKIRDMAPKPFEELQAQIMEKLQSSTLEHLEPIMNKNVYAKKGQYCIHRLFIDLYNSFIYNNYVIKERLENIDIRRMLTNTFQNYYSSLQAKKLVVKLNMPQQYSIMRSQTKYIQILFGNIVQYCVQGNINSGIIYIKISNNIANVLDFNIKFSSTDLQVVKFDTELQISGYIISQLGPLPYIKLSYHQKLNHIEFAIYQNQLEDKLGIIRKASQCNFVKIMPAPDAQ